MHPGVPLRAPLIRFNRPETANKNWDAYKDPETRVRAISLSPYHASTEVSRTDQGLMQLKRAEALVCAPRRSNRMQARINDVMASTSRASWQCDPEMLRVLRAFRRFFANTEETQIREALKSLEGRATKAAQEWPRRGLIKTG